MEAEDGADDGDRASLLQQMLGLDEPSLWPIHITSEANAARRSRRVASTSGAEAGEAALHDVRGFVDYTVTPVAPHSHWVRLPSVGVSFPCSRAWHLYTNRGGERMLGVPVSVAIASHAELPQYADGPPRFAGSPMVGLICTRLHGVMQSPVLRGTALGNVTIPPPGAPRVPIPAAGAAALASMLVSMRITREGQSAVSSAGAGNPSVDVPDDAAMHAAMERGRALGLPVDDMAPSERAQLLQLLNDDRVLSRLLRNAPGGDDDAAEEEQEEVGAAASQASTPMSGCEIVATYQLVQDGGQAADGPQPRSHTFGIEYVIGGNKHLHTVLHIDSAQDAVTEVTFTAPHGPGGAHWDAAWTGGRSAGTSAPVGRRRGSARTPSTRDVAVLLHTKELPGAVILENLVMLPREDVQSPPPDVDDAAAAGSTAQPVFAGKA